MEFNFIEIIRYSNVIPCGIVIDCALAIDMRGNQIRMNKINLIPISFIRFISRNLRNPRINDFIYVLTAKASSILLQNVNKRMPVNMQHHFPLPADKQIHFFVRRSYCYTWTNPTRCKLQENNFIRGQSLYLFKMTKCPSTAVQHPIVMVFDSCSEWKTFVAKLDGIIDGHIAGHRWPV